MKKLLLCVVFAATIITATSCGSSDPFTMYNKAMTSFLAADSSETNSTAKVTVEKGGQTQDNAMAINSKQAKVKDSYDANLTLTVNSSGTPITANAYYTNGYSYLNAMGSTSKTKMTYEKFTSQFGSDGMMSFKSSDIDSKKTTTKKVDKGTEMTFIIKSDSEAGKAVIGKEETSLASYSGKDVAGLGATASDITYIVTVDSKDKLVSSNEKYDISFSSQGEVAKFSYDVKVDVVNIGSTKVDLPADLDTYTEVPDTTAPAASDSSAATPSASDSSTMATPSASDGSTMATPSASDSSAMATPSASDGPAMATASN